LDRALREQLQQELREVLQRTGIPAIYVTHDQEEALALGDRMALLNEGQIVQIGSPDVFYRWPKNLWVAQFLAMENVFSGQVVKTVPLQVQTAIGLLHASTASGSNLTSGDQVTLVITPAADFTLLNGEQINLVKGVCRDCLFMGEYYQITLSLQGGQNFVFRSNHAVNKGVEIPFCLPVENVICLK
jgi:ABC-type Fe3+/spermidine/putrescine transport system ATPase subunit